MQVLSEDVAPEVIPCRQKQIADIEGFILDAINMTYSPEVLYIAGVPGIGKDILTLGKTICVKDAIRRI
jgi:Cdc6-like AAA superfamily ATPase